MDAIISAALEEICARGTGGIPLPDLWPGLGAALSSAGLHPCDAVRRALWDRLLSLPGLDFVPPRGSLLNPRDASIQSFDKAESLGVRIVAKEQLRDSFLGIYDLKAADGEISKDQRRALERLALSRANGVTQSALTKEFGVTGNTIFYILRGLEWQQLIVRQSTIVRTIESGDDVENRLKATPVVSTKKLYLYRYAKRLNLLDLGSQQRIEITRPEVHRSLGDADVSSSIDNGASGECVEEDVCIQDYVPAMKVICDKLDEANGKVLVVSDIKKSLGYIKTSGHRAWRNILSRLIEACLVEEFMAKVNGVKKATSCLRLLKKFDPNTFETKIGPCGYDRAESKTLIPHSKKGQTTDQLVELPIEHCIYDMIDAEGTKGVTLTEICKRLGLNGKRTHSRIVDMCPRFGLHMLPEMHKKTKVHRVWTTKNYQQYTSKVFSNNVEECSVANDLSVHSKEFVPHNQVSVDIRSLDTCSSNEVLPYENLHGEQTGPEIPVILSDLPEDAHVAKFGKKPNDATLEIASVDDYTQPGPSRSVAELSIIPSDASVLTPPRLPSSRRDSCVTPTVLNMQREQRILSRLKEDKFLLAVELYRWLEDLEKDTLTTMDRKTLTRILNKLQQEGLCKCTQVMIPATSNCSRSRKTVVVVLHPSVDDLSPELLDQIYHKQRNFDVHIRGRGSARSLNDQPMAILAGVKRPPSFSDAQPIISGSKSANGFILAKMVRVKLFHIFLWGYLGTLPDWENAFDSEKHGYNLKNPHSTCEFLLDTAVKAMPLELFLQVVGSAKEIDNLVESCRAGLRLSDLPVALYHQLLDSNASGRLSCIVDILIRLKLIRIVREGCEAAGLRQANLAHAIELKPYIEEPLPKALTSSNANKSDLYPKLRHDFVLSSKESVDAYWETLEYCYATADQATASHVFPGSAVREVYHSRSWASIRVMKVEQRMELYKRIAEGGPTKKVPFKECVKIAGDLNLTVEQVLRVSYEKRQSCLDRHSKKLKRRMREPGSDSSNSVPISKKRRHLLDECSQNAHADSDSIELSSAVLPLISDGHEQNSHNKFITDGTSRSCEIPLHDCKDDTHASSKSEFEPREADCEDCAFIGKRASPGIKPMRRPKFSWTEESDRRLVIRYATHRASLGPGIHRVDWSSLSNLPAIPDSCRRRMAALNSDVNFRKAVMRLCNLLAQRYSKRLEQAHSTRIQDPMLEEDLHQSATLDDASESNFQVRRWDDFEDPVIKEALDDVLQYKKMIKMEYAKRLGSRQDKEWPDFPPIHATTLNTDSFEPNMSSSEPEGDRIHLERCQIPSNNTSTSGQRRSNSDHLRGKFLKLFSNRSTSIKRQVRESLAVANAVELLKLVFLSTSAPLEVQISLGETLRLYSENDIFAAFNYLKEKEFMVAGDGNRPFVLSQKFWHNSSYSPFPINSGKRARSFSSWLHKQEKDLMEDGTYLTSDLQCGEVLHLFALVSSGDLYISPCLPKEGIGEADGHPGSKSLLSKEDECHDNVPKSLKRKKKPRIDEKVKKLKPLEKADKDFCFRREKGFPGIKVSLKRATVSVLGTMQCLTDEDSYNHALSCVSAREASISMVDLIELPPPSIKSRISVQSADSQQETIWDHMTSYAALFSTKLVMESEQITFSPDLFKIVHSTIKQAGEQGLSMEEVSRAMCLEGLLFAEIVINTLGIFQLAVKVNAYDSVRVVDSSYRSKYCVRFSSGCNRDLCLSPNTKPHMSYGASKPLQGQNSILSCQDTRLNLRNEHRHNDAPTEPSIIPIQPQSVEDRDVTPEERIKVKAPFQGNEVKNDKCSAEGDGNVYRPIVPWISGDGSTNNIVYKGLARRLLGIVMQNPGVLEDDIIDRIGELNPQSCRCLLETMVLDNHLMVRRMFQSQGDTPPTILRNLFGSNFKKPESVFRRHFFANPMSTSLL